MRTESQIWARAAVVQLIGWFEEGLARLSDSEAYEYPETYSLSASARENVALGFRRLRAAEHDPPTRYQWVSVQGEIP